MNPTYESIMKVDTYESLPMNVDEGAIAYCRDTKRHYMFDMAAWTMVSDRTQAQIDAAASGKANVSHTHTVSDVTGLTAFLADKAGANDYTFYKEGGVIRPIKEYATNTPVLSSGGSFRFYLTDNFLSTGNAIFSSGIITGTVNLVIVDPSGASYSTGSITLSGSRKYVDIAVKKGIINLVTLVNVYSAIPDGVTGYLSVKGT